MERNLFKIASLQVSFWTLTNRFDLNKINLDICSSDYVAEELLRSHSKRTLYQIQFHVVLLQNVEGLTQMFDMFMCFQILYQHIIDIYIHEFPDDVFEHAVYKLQVC